MWSKSSEKGERTRLGERISRSAPGGCPVLPILLHLIGAERIITIDINAWLTEGQALETLRMFQGRTSTTSAKLQVPERPIADRLRSVIAASRDLESLLHALNVRYVCPGDAADTRLPGDSIDFVCSSNVLEHMRRR